jgi:pyridoxal phosphate enzyme (YggS family)
MEDIAENLRGVRERIARACGRAGRDPGSVTLVAVSKTKGAADVEAAYGAGQRVFGENYVQELLQKLEALAHLEGIAWHFIGKLQRNKVRHLVGRVEMIESVDSARLAAEIERRAGDLGRKVEVLVEVNVGGEATKGGSSADEVRAVLEAVAASRWLVCRGLMAIPPVEDDPERSRRWFVMMREMRETLGGEKLLPELSMGMTGDFEAAIEEGATIVRVGTAIFGERRVP